MMKIAIASDLSGYPMKKAIVEHLKERGDVEVLDFGIPNENEPHPYVEQAPKVCKAIQSGEAEKGILICGTGQGMAIVANKHKGIYACVVDSIFSGERAKIINNANVITLGGWVTAPFLGCEIVDAWLAMKFTKDFLTKNFHIVEDIEKENFR